MEYFAPESVVYIGSSTVCCSHSGGFGESEPSGSGSSGGASSSGGIQLPFIPG